MSAAASSHTKSESSIPSSNHLGKHQENSSQSTVVDHDPFFSKSEKKGSFFQAKLLVNKIDDPYEQEADKVADEVTQSIFSGGDDSFIPPAASDAGDGSGQVNRKAFFQRKAAFDSPTELDQNSAHNSDLQRKALSPVDTVSKVDTNVAQRRPAFESPTEMDLNTAANEQVQRSSQETPSDQTSSPPPNSRQDDENENPAELIQRNPKKLGDQDEVNATFEQNLSSSKGSGQPLSSETKGKMESNFNADFSKVRIHTDSSAENMSDQVKAHAFTHGSDIYFNKGTYNPNTREGTNLLAHELTHVVQQGGAPRHSVQRKARVSINQSARPMVQRGVIQKARNWAAGKAAHIPGYTMLTVILGFDPISGNDVTRNAANIFRAIMGFMPGGELIYQALQNHGIFDKVGNWLVQKFEELKAIGSSIVSAFKEFLNSLGWRDIFRLGSLWRRAVKIFTVPIKRIIRFVVGLVKDILVFIRDAILKPLARLAEGTRGWDLLIAILGTNPITGESVPRTADTLIGGFMKLIGQEEVWQNIKKANALARAWAWFQGNLGKLIGFVSKIPGLFIKALKSLEIMDLVLVPRAFIKVGKVFAGFIGDFISWAGGAVWDLLKIIFEVVAPGAIPYLNKSAASFKSILANPIGFLGNLVQAGKLGFNMFKENFVSILKDVLIDWLTGTLAGAGIYIPQGLTFYEILKFILSILGISWGNIRAKLVEHLGEGPVVVLEEGFELIQILVTEGPAAAWEKIKEHLANLQEMVISEIITFVSTTVVTKAIVKLVGSLNPVGAFISAIITIYDVIVVFIQRLQKIIEVGMAFMNSINEIVAGNIQPAAQKIVTTLKGILTLAVSFLAGFAGIGKITTAIQNILKKVRDPIDKALDKVIGWIAGKAKGFLKKKDNNDHAAIANEASEELKQGSGKEVAYDDLRKEKEAKAKEIEQKHQGKLKDNVKIRIAFTAAAADKADDDLDFTVIIAPNDTKKKDAVPAKEGVTKIKINRSTFRFSTKKALQESDSESHKKGSKPLLKKNLDRRHIISSQNMAVHYESVLNGKKWSAAKKILEKRKPVEGKPVNNKAIQKTAKALHKDFFNDVKNLFVGDSSINRSLGERVDIPDEWNKKAYRKHLAYIKNTWTLDDSFKVIE